MQPSALSVSSDSQRSDCEKAVAERLQATIAALSQRSGDAADGREWEWAAPAVIDAMAGGKSVAWVASPYGFATLGDEEGFKEHVAELRTAAMAAGSEAKTRAGPSCR